jgi:hypothetical protein
MLAQERLGFAEALEFLGFNYDTSMSMLRYWTILRLSAPAGGPYDLLGIALAAIAELGEPGTQTRTCHGEKEKTTKAPCPRSEWRLVFAQALNYEGLRSIRRAGAYLAPNFTKAKWLVYRMVLRRWDELVQRRKALYGKGC